MTEYLITLILFGSLLLLMLVFIIVVFMKIHRQRLHHDKLELMRIRGKLENELLWTRLEVEEQAFNKLSAELHDNTGQLLSGVWFKLLSLFGSEMEPRLQKEYREILDRLNDAIFGLRNLSHILNGVMVEKLGIVEALEKELAFVRSIHKLDCSFDYSRFHMELHDGQDILLFRICQEAINNILKHAKATRLSIRMLGEKGRLELMIADNGIGLSAGHPGLGLRNMQERIKMLQGNMTIESCPGKGAKLLFTCNLI